MGTFSGSLRAMGDVRSLPATIELADGHLSIVAGSTEIGSWSLTEIHLEEMPTGYRMSAEGEQILLEIKNLTSFAAELDSRSKKRLRIGRDKERKEDKKPESSPSEPVAPPPVEARSMGTKMVDPAPGSTRTPTSKKEDSGIGGSVLQSIDNLLIKAKKRFGPYLPDVMFSRAMFFLAVGALVVMVILPGVFSVLLLVMGVLLVLFGAVLYSDSVLASRWLPGRATPQQALLLGLSVLLAGVLLGILAK